MPASVSLKSRLLSGAPVLAAFLFTDAPENAEIMAIAGFDALIVDHEHVASDMSRALAQLRAIRSVSDTPVLVRIRDHGEGSIKPLLDAGFDGIIAANVTSADAALRIVEAAHYPPLGRRGAHYTVSRAAHCGALSTGAVDEARQETLVVAMIESAAGLGAIPDIAQVRGIDMLFVGPLDLTADFGTYGDLGNKELKRAILKFEQAVITAGLMLGGALIPGDTPQKAYNRGYRLVTGASDVGLLLNAAKAAVNSGRS